MEHRVTLLSNPRLLGIPAIIVALLAGSAWLYTLLGPVWGLVAVGLAIFMDLRLGTVLKNILASGIETTPDGVHVTLSNGRGFYLSVAEISVAGSFSLQGRPGIFLFADEKDQFFSCPDHFTHFPELLAWLKEKLPFEEHPELDMAGVKALLKERYGATDEDDPAAADSEAPAASADESAKSE